MNYSGGQKKLVDVTRKFWPGLPRGTTHPPDPHPLPLPRQKGYQSAPFTNGHPSAYSSRPETEMLQSNGAKTEIRMPMHT